MIPTTESTSRQERVRNLRELYASVAAESTFTEHQEVARGAVLDDRDVEAGLRELVAGMRARYGFRSGLDDAALAAVVRGFYAGSSDDGVAERLGVTARQVARARRNLHLFRPADTDAPFDLSALRGALSGGVTAAEAARELGVPESTASRYAGVLRRRADARRSGYYYPAEFESLLGIADGRDLAAVSLVDRRTMAEIVD
ncbi:conditioned medium-induced protein 4 [Salinirubellus sp. GCM10025818]|uniref:conditioned medium-induced protein 4 n=1 Tax=Salinirubellus TaxID=2162630 RepID=UPI0030CC1063